MLSRTYQDLVRWALVPEPLSHSNLFFPNSLEEIQKEMYLKKQQKTRKFLLESLALTPPRGKWAALRRGYFPCL